jgi:hypothetical protein
MLALSLTSAPVFANRTDIFITMVIAEMAVLSLMFTFLVVYTMVPSTARKTCAVCESGFFYSIVAAIAVFIASAVLSW